MLSGEPLQVLSYLCLERQQLEPTARGGINESYKPLTSHLRISCNLTHHIFYNYYHGFRTIWNPHATRQEELRFP